MKRAVSRLFLPALVLFLLFAASPALAMPLSEKASVNTSMPFYLVVDLTNQYVTAFDTKTNEPVRYMICSSGRISGTTPTGTFRIQSDAVYSWVAFESCYIRYGKRITGSIWFHSILYRSRSVSSLISDSFYKLGSPASHGCVRLTPIDAQWISYNCKKGTTVRILRASKTSATKEKAAELKSALKAAGHKGIQPTLTPTPRPTLSLGSTGALVKSLNSRLRSLGFYPAGVTSSFTEDTKAAVEAYQTAAGLTVTGEADSALQKKIAGNDSITGRLVSLKYGDKYVAVKALQKQLKALGYLKASFKLSTSFDKTTRSAVTAFQTLAGITPADGVASPAVQNLLFSAAAPTPTPTPPPVYATTNHLASLYKSKSTSSARVAVIQTNKQVIVLVASDGKWTKAKYGSRSGYMLSKYLGPTPDPTSTA
jgi:peptidoglycan hydrolase-like protein with peptidoglycan-binding domain